MSSVRIRNLVRPYVPAAILDINSRRKLQVRRARFESLKNSVATAIRSIQELHPSQCVNVGFLEKEFIPSLGLNDEFLHEQPPEFSHSFGKGLHIWQYPIQLAPYLAWLAKNTSHVASFMEIGCRWGGMFILVAEWMKKTGAPLKSVCAVDPIEPTPFIRAYFDILKTTSIEATYLREFSTSDRVRAEVERTKPDFVFIDADHTLRGAMSDHLLVRDHADIIVHHDIHSQSCPDTTFLWNALKSFEDGRFDFAEFTGQYQSVEGHFMGIGAMKRVKC